MSEHSTREELARRYAAAIVDGTLPRATLDLLGSVAGLHVDGCVIWFRDHDETVVVWSGADDVTELPINTIK